MEQLKEYCNDIEVQYKQLLSYNKTRWLTLLQDLKRPLKVFKPYIIVLFEIRKMSHDSEFF